VPVDERRDAVLSHHADSGAAPRWHLDIPRERFFQTIERRRRKLTRDGLQPGESRLCGAHRRHLCVCSGQLSPPAEPVVPAFTSCRRYLSMACFSTVGSSSPLAASDWRVRTTI